VRQRSARNAQRIEECRQSRCRIIPYLVHEGKKSGWKWKKGRSLIAFAAMARGTEYPKIIRSGSGAISRGVPLAIQEDAG
jgi:hypothetical protein